MNPAIEQSVQQESNLSVLSQSTTMKKVETETKTEVEPPKKIETETKTEAEPPKSSNTKPVLPKTESSKPGVSKQSEVDNIRKRNQYLYQAYLARQARRRSEEMRRKKETSTSNYMETSSSFELMEDENAEDENAILGINPEEENNLEEDEEEGVMGTGQRLRSSVSESSMSYRKGESGRSRHYTMPPQIKVSLASISSTFATLSVKTNQDSDVWCTAVSSRMYGRSQINWNKISSNAKPVRIDGTATVKVNHLEPRQSYNLYCYTPGAPPSMVFARTKRRMYMET